MFRNLCQHLNPSYWILWNDVFFQIQKSHILVIFAQHVLAQLSNNTDIDATICRKEFLEWTQFVFVIQPLFYIIFAPTDNTVDVFTNWGKNLKILPRTA